MTKATEAIKQVTIQEGREIVQSLNNQFGREGWSFSIQTNDSAQLLGITAQHKDNRAMTDAEKTRIDELLSDRKVITNSSQEKLFPTSAIFVVDNVHKSAANLSQTP